MRINKPVAAVAASGSAWVGVLLAQAAFAQADGSQDDTQQLNTVVVTAERRAEKEQDVPISITSINAQQLEQSDTRSLADIQKLTPALRFDTSGPYSEPTIRGVGSAVVTSGAGSNVGVYVDGFYLINQQTLNSQLLNVDDVQVLKGPQGTLFGHNTTGGAILINTTKPSHDTSGILDVSYGSYNSQRYQGYFTTGLTDRLAVDVAASLDQGSGYVRDIVTGSDSDGAYKNWLIRAGLKFDPTDNLSVLFRYLHERTDDPTAVMYSAHVQNGAAQAPGAVYPGAITPTRPNTVADNAGSTFINLSDGYYLTVNLDLDFAALTSYTQYRHDLSETVGQDYAVTTVTAPDFTCGGGAAYCHLLGLNIPTNDKTFTQEFLLSSKSSGPLKWTAGVFYMDYTDLIDASLNQLGGPYGAVARNGTDTRSIASYGDATYEFLPQWYFTAGLRYSHDVVRNAFFQEPPLPPGPTVVLPDLDTNRVAPRAVLRYAPTLDSSVYFSFSRGFKSAIYNVGGDQTDSARPESINAYEVGYKYAASGFSFDTAAYYYDYSDLQVAYYTAAPVPASLVTNAASSRIYGLEAQAQYQVTRGFSVSASGAYTDAKYRNFQGSPTYTQCLNFATCGASFGLFTSGSINETDTTMLRAPKFSGNLSSRYALPLFNGEFALSGSFYYTASFYFDSSDVDRQGAYALLNLRAEWTDPSRRLTLAVYGDNVTDKQYLTQVFASNPAIAATWGRPASVFGEIKYHFH